MVKPSHCRERMEGVLLEQAYTVCCRVARKYKLFTSAIGRDDLVQSAMVRVWRALDTYDRTQPWEAYVTTIAENVCKSACGGRHNDITFYLEDIHWEKGEHGSRSRETAPAEDGSKYEKEPAARQVYDMTGFLSRLPNRQRHVIEKSYGVGHSDWEESDERIASELGVTRQTVITDRKKALMTLKDYADDLYMEMSA